MAISAGTMPVHHVGMATTTNATLSAPGGALRRLSLLPAGRRPLNRDEALRQVRSVRRHVESRADRFAHLKRVYD
jgi:hypothetical protein